MSIIPEGLLPAAESIVDMPPDDPIALHSDAIRFRFVQPMRPYPEYLQRFIWKHPLLRTALERINTRLGNSALSRRLHRLGRMPRMSTVAIGSLVQRAVALMPAGQVYLNVGVWRGFTLFAGMLGNPEKRCIGVDDFSMFDSPRDAFLHAFNACRSPAHTFVEGDYRAYFAAQNHHPPIGVYYYDGKHSYEQQLDGLRRAEPFFALGCLIIVDDTNWEEPRSATFTFMRESSQRYRVVRDIRTAGNRHLTWWNGLLVIRKV